MGVPALAYGLVCSVIFLFTFRCAIAAAGNLLVSRTDRNAIAASLRDALARNVVLLGRSPSCAMSAT